MGRKRGGNSAAVRAELAERLEHEYRLQPHLAHQYANQVADAVADDLSKCTATGGWVGKEAGVPSGFTCLVARAIEDQLAGDKICGSTGKKRDHASNESSALGITVSPTGETAARGENATPNVGDIAAHGASAAQQGEKMVPGVHAAAGVGQDGMLGMLGVQPRVVDGYELQWQAAAISALDRLQVELQVQVVSYYSTQCAAGQELFVREWQRKTSGILSHRKKKEKQRSK